jgi:hypothetical protein
MPELPPSVAPLAERLPRGADAGRIADEVSALWVEVDQALHPILGHGGVAALFNRSMMLTASARPWMVLERCDVVGLPTLASLHTALAQQSAAEAEAGGRALLSAFEGLLVSLVGPALTARLLLPVRQGGAPQ